jgi:hypothetical protein
MRHASACGAGVRRKPAFADYCTDALGPKRVRTLLIAGARAERAVEKPRLARKNVHQAALEELCRHARALHQQRTEQHVEEQRVFTLRALPAAPDAARLREYEAAVEGMSADIRAAAALEQQGQYDPVALSLPENSLRLVCDLLRTRPGEALEPADYALVQEFGHGAREHLDKLVLGALATHCEALAACVARNAQAAHRQDWAGCMQLAWKQAAASELNRKRQASANMQQLRVLVATLEHEHEAEAAARAGV